MLFFTMEQIIILFVCCELKFYCGTYRYGWHWWLFSWHVLKW